MPCFLLTAQWPALIRQLLHNANETLIIQVQLFSFGYVFIYDLLNESMRVHPI